MGILYEEITLPLIRLCRVTNGEGVDTLIKLFMRPQCSPRENLSCLPGGELTAWCDLQGTPVLQPQGIEFFQQCEKACSHWPHSHHEQRQGMSSRQV